MERLRFVTWKMVAEAVVCVLLVAVLFIAVSMTVVWNHYGRTDLVILSAAIALVAWTSFAYLMLPSFPRPS